MYIWVVGTDMNLKVNRVRDLWASLVFIKGPASAHVQQTRFSLAIYIYGGNSYKDFVARVHNCIDPSL